MLNFTLGLIAAFIPSVAIATHLLDRLHDTIGDLRGRLLQQQVDWDLHCAQAEKVANTTATARAFKKQLKR